MYPLSIPIKLLLSFLIGAAIGVERESSNTPKTSDEKIDVNSIGLRTFSLIVPLGTISALFFQDYLPISLFISISFGLILLAYYLVNSFTRKDIGITTEVAILHSYVLGICIGLEFLPIQLIVAIAVIMIMVLSRKHEINRVIASIRRNEIHAFVSFAIVALVILPFLPNYNLSIGDIPGVVSILASFGLDHSQMLNIGLINPFRLWFLVALVSGIDILGYILERFVRVKEGKLLTSLIGGFVSSTATTQSLAQESKRSNKFNGLVAAAIFANVASFVQLIFLTAPVNAVFFAKLFPILCVLVVSGSIVGIYVHKRSKRYPSLDTEELLRDESKQIFSLGPALKFAIIFTLVKVISQVSLLYFGSKGVLLTSILASFTGIDAVVINLAELAGSTLTMQAAVFIVIIVNTMNLVSKSIYSAFQGKWEFTLRFATSMAFIVLSSLIGYLFFF